VLISAGEQGVFLFLLDIYAVYRKVYILSTD